MGTAIIEEDEEDCLQYLNKLEVEEFEDIKSGSRIKLYFDKNPYFDNECLTKEFHLGSSGDPASQSTPIQWKEGMDLAAKFAQRQAAAQESAKGRKRLLQSHNERFLRGFATMETHLMMKSPRSSKMICGLIHYSISLCLISKLKTAMTKMTTMKLRKKWMNLLLCLKKKMKNW